MRTETLLLYIKNKLPDKPKEFVSPQKHSPAMDTSNNPKKKPTYKLTYVDEPSVAGVKPKTNEELNKEKPSRQNRRQATESQLNNPLHGVKLAEILERLVAHYGWKYLADRTNIRCFMYNPTMKSSLGFLRKMKWAREFVKDIYVGMLDEVDSNGSD